MPASIRRSLAFVMLSAIPGALLFLQASPRATAGPPRDGTSDGAALRSGWFEILYPESLGDSGHGTAKRIATFLGRLQEDLDARFVEAGALSASRARARPHPRKLWSVRIFPTRPDCHAFLKERNSNLPPNAPGTHFWCGPEYARPVLTVALDEVGESPSKLCSSLLTYGSKLIVYHRLGVNMHLRSEDRGVALLEGFEAYLAYSFQPDEGGYPYQLGGCPLGVVEGQRGRVQGTGFPDLEALFTAAHREFNRDRDGLYHPALLLVEYLLQTGDPKVFYKHLATYRKRGFGTDGRAALKQFMTAFKARDPEQFMEDVRKYVLDASKTVNEKKWADRDKTRAGSVD